jgi:sulfate adenylyltransferase large subunit
MDIDIFLNKHENKDLLRLLTSGSVDDGKSTLIGRLLYDSKLIFDDQLNALHEDSGRHGTTQNSGEIDYALLLDGLKAEREQGITIDVAYRYFATPKRKFIIADTPGHEQYTRNMATGASTANLAIILIDARYGVVTQTKRHAFIISLLGIKHLIVAVNKMDLVDFKREIFLDIRETFKTFAQKLDIPDITFIPLSALKGDNVVEFSPHMDWYNGKPLLQILEEVDITEDRNLIDFRFPVQYVNRPHLNFRGYSGSVLSGIVKVGDTVKALPSGKESIIKEIVTADGKLDQAFPPQAVTLTLHDEIDISSGDMLVHANNTPKMAKRFEAVIVWMNETELKPSEHYLLRHAGRNVKARIESLKYKVDVNTHNKSESDSLKLNEIGKVVVTTAKPIFFDAYAKNRETGSFILIDTTTNNTLGAGMIIASLTPEQLPDNLNGTDYLATHINQREFAWDSGHITVRDRTIKNRHKGKALLITGNKGVGKHDFAKNLEKALFDLNMQSYYLGMSGIVKGLDADIGDSFWDWDEHIRRLGELTRIFTDAGLIVIAPLNEADSFDIKKLRRLNFPNELLVVNLGSLTDKTLDPDLNLLAEPNSQEALNSILELLIEKKIIPEYYI